MIEKSKQDNESFYAPGRVAKSGDYLKALENSCFKGSKLLPRAFELIEQTKFEESFQETLEGIEKRGIDLEFVFREDMQRGTKIDNNKETMVLANDFEFYHPAKKTWVLIHRNMSLILQRIGKREDPNFLKQLLRIDLMYAQTLRLGALKLKGEEKITTLNLADSIEIKARKSLSTLF